MAGKRLSPSFRPEHFCRTGLIVGCLAAGVVLCMPLVFGLDVFGTEMWISFGAVHTIAWIPAAVMHRCAWWRVTVLAIPSFGFILWGMLIGMFTLLVGPLFIALLWALVVAILLGSTAVGILLCIAGVLATAAWFVGYFLSTPHSLYGDDNALLVATVWHGTAAFAFYYAFAIETKRDRRDDGLFCISCGFSLVGLTTDTCPECGEPITAPQPPQAPASAP